MFLEKVSRCKLCEMGAAAAQQAIHPPSPSPPVLQPPPISSFMPSFREFMITAYLLRGYYQPAGPLISHHHHHSNASTSSSVPTVSGVSSSKGSPGLEPQPRPAESTSEPADYRGPGFPGGYPPHPYTYQYLQGSPYHQDCYATTYYKYPPNYHRRYWASPVAPPPPSTQMVTSEPYPGGQSGSLDPYSPHPPPPPPPGVHHGGYYSYAPGPAPPPPPPPCFTHSGSRGLFIDPYNSCPCPIQSCPKNVHTGPLTGASKGSGQTIQAQTQQGSQQSNIVCIDQQQQSSQEAAPAPLPPVALALPLEPNGAHFGPPSPARGSAGMPPPASPALSSTARNPPSWSPPGGHPVPIKEEQQMPKELPTPPPEQTVVDLPLCDNNLIQRRMRPTKRKASIEAENLEPPINMTVILEQPPIKKIRRPPTPVLVQEPPMNIRRPVKKLKLEEKMQIDKKLTFTDKITEEKKQQPMEKPIPIEAKPQQTTILPQQKIILDKKPLLQQEKTILDIKPSFQQEKPIVDKKPQAVEIITEEKRIPEKLLDVKPVVVEKPTPPERKPSIEKKCFIEKKPLVEKKPVVVKKPLVEKKPLIENKAQTEKKVQPEKRPSIEKKVVPEKKIQLLEKPVEKKAPIKPKAPPKSTAKRPINGTKKETSYSKSRGLKAESRKKRKSSLTMKEEMDIVPITKQPTLRWSNGWSWEGEPFRAKVFLTSDEPEMRTCYPAMRHVEGDVIYPRDSILLKSGPRKQQLPFVAKVTAMWENPDDGEMVVSLLWYYRPEHTEQGRLPLQPEDEIFASRHKDVNSVACIEDKCYVLTYNEYCRYKTSVSMAEAGITHDPRSVVPEPENGYPRASRLPKGQVSKDILFFCRKIYDFRQKRLLKNRSS